MKDQRRYFYVWDDVEEEWIAPDMCRRVISGEKATMCIFRLKTHASGIMHRHNVFEQISYVTKGRLRVRCGEEERVMGPGEVVCVPSGVDHQFEALDEETWFVDAFAPAREDFIREREARKKG